MMFFSPAVLLFFFADGVYDVEMNEVHRRIISDVYCYGHFYSVEEKIQ